MALWFLLASFLLFLSCCLAETVTLRGALRERQLRASDRSVENPHFLPPVRSTLGRSDESLKLLDICLAASVDGRIRALNRSSGQLLWTLPSPSAYASSQGPPAALGPLVRTQHVEIDPLHGDGDNEELYIVEPQTGNIYILPRPDAPLQALPFSMPQLVDMSPFSFSLDNVTRMFVGKKETSLLIIELETGRLKGTISSDECPWGPFGSWDNGQSSAELDLDELDGTKPAKDMPVSTEVIIGRTDYHISIYTKPSSINMEPPPVQNLTFSIYGPNNQDQALQLAYRRTPDDVYIQSTPSGEIYTFKVSQKQSNGWPSKDDSMPIWINSFPKPVVAIFDVLETPNRQHPLALLQPQPRLQDVLPDFDLDGPESRGFSHVGTYIGLVGDNSSSLFAMSPDTYPLVIFHRRTEEEMSNTHSIRKTINAPPGEVGDGSDGDFGELPLDVDSITRLRKEKELCVGGSGKWDRRCAVGMRPVEASASRLNRLLPERETSHDRPTGMDETRQQEGQGINNSGSQFTVPSIDAESPVWDRPLTTFAGSVLAFSLFVGGFLYMVKRTKIANVPATANRVGSSGAVESSSSSTYLELPETNGHAIHASDHARATPTITELVESKPSVYVDQKEPVVIRPLTPKPAQVASPPQKDGHSGEWMVLGNQQDGEGDDESENEGDLALTPGKKRGTRRRKRGKKNRGSTAVIGSSQDGPLEEKVESLAEESDLVALLPNPVLLTPSLSTPKLASSSTTPMQLTVSDEVLGFGSHGTVVYRGSLQGRAVAVKRLLQDFTTLASREVNILQESDDHPNVIRYYYQEAQANFLYIALELCPASLADIIESPQQHQDIINVFDPKRALSQITSGLRYLHALKIIHRDIKPQNILISGAKKGAANMAGHRMLISDFGLCRKLEMDQTSFLPTANGGMAAGTVGWRAPEILRGEVKLDDSVMDDSSQSSRSSTGTAVNGSTPHRVTRLTKSIDIFSLGCLFFYILSNGGHPYGERFEREMNILKDVKSLESLESFGEEGLEAIDLISQMLDREASRRPDTTACLTHPYFWGSARRLGFLADASDRFEIMCRDPREDNLIELEKDAPRVVGTDWHSRLDRVFIENLGKFRKYDGRSVQDLMRALRNKKHHYQDLPPNVKRHLGALPDGFLAYFTRRFPHLFMHVHDVVRRTGLREESMFQSYFELSE